MSAFTTERGLKLEAFRDHVETVVAEFPAYWKSGPMKHTLYAAVIRGIISGHIPVPPAE